VSASRTATLVPAIALLAVLAPALGGEGPAAAGAGRVILTEGSVWRTHVVWGNPMMQGASGLKEAKIWHELTSRSAPPAENWTQPDFDDSAWGLWCETHVPGTLKTKDGKDTGIRLYDDWQYGVQLSTYTALRCLRGKFTVEDPAQVKSLTFSAAYRGGVVVYLNGQEVGRANVPKPAQPDAAPPAEAYPDEIYYTPDGKPTWLLDKAVPAEPAALELFNKRIRTATIPLATAALRKGTNVLAVAVHRAPYSEKAEREGMRTGWSACGVATIELRGEGAVAPAVGRPKGLQVWNANLMTKVSLLGNSTPGRWGQGAGTTTNNYPLSWTSPSDPLVPMRIVGTRNGVFSGQAVVSSDAAIRGLGAVASDLVQAKGGAGRIPAVNCQVYYQGFPDEPPALIIDPAVSLLDVLYEKPPAEVPAQAAKPRVAALLGGRDQALSWADAGALVPVWLKVRVPADAPAGDYEGTLTISADESKPVAVPVKLVVHGFVLPDPKNFATHTGLTHSPDTLAIKYKVPLWSDQHFKLMEKSCAYMGELGGKAVWLPLIADTWLGNQQSLVYWVRQADGSYKYDFKVFDKYLDMIQKHLKPEAVNIFVFQPNSESQQAVPKGQVSVLDPSGKVSSMEAPPYAPGAASEAFWKPVISEVRERLKQRGLPEPNYALVQEQGWSQHMPEVVELFKAVWPEGKWAQLAHGGGAKGVIHGVPYGYVMSVWGSTYSPWKPKKWGAPEIPCVFIEHYRADRLINLRPIAWRGGFYLAADAAMGGTKGIGPLGMDFWNMTAQEGGWKGGSRCVEKYVCNLNMSVFSAGAFLAPGPDGPIPTARFEAFREGLQVNEARAVIERALGDPARRQQLGDALAKRCEGAIRENRETFACLSAGEPSAEGEGWRWFETSGWEERTGTLFAIAAEVAKALGGGR